MIDEKLKPNNSRIIFMCCDSLVDKDNFLQCVYKSGDPCKYRESNYECGSTLAMVNRMILELKRLGVNNE